MVLLAVGAVDMWVVGMVVVGKVAAGTVKVVMVVGLEGAAGLVAIQEALREAVRVEPDHEGVAEPVAAVTEGEELG